MTCTNKINTIALLYDVINQYTTEIEPELKHSLKQLTNRANSSLGNLIRSFDRIYEGNVDFGNKADELRNIIDEFLNESNIENKANYKGSNQL